MLTVDLFRVYLLLRVDIVIRYIEVDFTFGLPDYVFISKNSLYRGSLYQSFMPYILLQLLLGHRMSFIILRTSLNRGSLNRGSTVSTVLANLPCRPLKFGRLIVLQETHLQL